MKYNQKSTVVQDFSIIIFFHCRNGPVCRNVTVFSIHHVLGGRPFTIVVSPFSRYIMYTHFFFLLVPNQFLFQQLLRVRAYAPNNIHRHCTTAPWIDRM